MIQKVRGHIEIEGVDMKKEYLGDSVYVRFDGYGFVLTTENGYGASNTIYLEPQVYRAMTAYYDKTLKFLDQSAPLDKGE